MSFFRHREIFRSDDRFRAGMPERTNYGPPQPHRLDEFPAGYSSAGCSPAEPASASPAAGHCALHSVYPSWIYHRTANTVLSYRLSLGAHPSRLLLRCPPRPYVALDPGLCGTPRQLELVALLHVVPVVRGEAEVPAQANGCVGGYRPLSVNDLVQPIGGNPQLACEPVHTDAQRIKQVLLENLAWVNRRAKPSILLRHYGLSAQRVRSTVSDQ